MDNIMTQIVCFLANNRITGNKFYSEINKISVGNCSVCDLFKFPSEV